MSWLSRLSSSPRARRGLAAAAVALSLGGLVLARTPNQGSQLSLGTLLGDTAASFRGPGAHGTLKLSQGKVVASAPGTLYAELTLSADDVASQGERAPLSLAIVFDTSGSMSGDKIERSKQSVSQLIGRMRDQDEIAFIRYDSSHEVLQPLERVGEVRSTLLQRIDAISAGGGTNIPPALSRGLDEVSRAAPGRVRRVVLVSDGLDSSRQSAEALARGSAASATTVSALGIGLDFDESYMSGVANAGRGNFGFVENSGALARFLNRELDESANTVVDDVRAHFQLPAGMRFVRAVGAEVLDQGQGQLSLALGSLFAKDERRVILELETQAEQGEQLALGTRLSWRRIGGANADVTVPQLQVIGDADRDAVAASRDPSVMASATSALASLRQLRAAEAYAKGDLNTANTLMDESLAALSAVAAEAPAADQAALERQRAEVASAKRSFRAASPKSAAAKSAGKASAAANAKNLGRKAF
ncbi:MAG: VWA domain-containing protein [Polyangiaceae bacterium]